IAACLLLCFLFVCSKAEVISFTKNADGVTLKLDKGLLFIRVCKADIVEVKYTIFDVFLKKTSLVVNNQWTAKTAFTVTDHNKSVSIKTPRLNIIVDKATNAITYTDLQ